MMRNATISTAFAMTILASAPAAAQSYFINDGQYRPETRMQVGLVIPLASHGEKIGNAPRLAFTLARHRYSETETVFRPSRITTQSNQLALTLNSTPRFLLNGRAMEKTDGKLGLSTGAGIAIGVSAVAGLLLIVAAEGSDNITDLVNPD